MYARYLLPCVLFVLCQLPAQSPSWQLWASGLPAGTYPRLAVAPNHDLYFGLDATGGPKGIIYKAHTNANQGNFTALPALPLPPSLQNNIQCLETSQNSEPVVGIFRNNAAEPWLFYFDHNAQTWQVATTDFNPVLGAYCMARAANGDLWVGAKWADVYRSTDDGHSFSRIVETASVQANHPCYYPSWFGNDYDGAIYGINVDGNGRVYAGTESAGVVYSDDQGQSWHPADYQACQAQAPTLKDSNSTLHPLSLSGNTAGIGFTTDNKLIWNGAAMWTLGWPNTLGCADMLNQTVVPAMGLPQYLITTGQQVPKIVTAANGQVFLYSGGATNASGIGIYTSMDGVHWTLFNTGITGALDNQSQGGLAVDGNLVFFATHDGKVWRCVLPEVVGTVEPALLSVNNLQPNPAGTEVQIRFNLEKPVTISLQIFDLLGRAVWALPGQPFPAGQQQFSCNVSALPAGAYVLQLAAGGVTRQQKLVIWH